MMGDYALALLGPLAWFAAHVASWIVVQGAHATEGASRLALVDLQDTAIALVVQVLAVRRFRGITDEAQRRRFVVGCAIALSLGSLLLLLGIALPPLLLPAGAEL